MTMYVITHKSFLYSIPKEYKILLVGANKNKGESFYLKDNKGENISNLNSKYCELTGMYWIWKNTSDKYVGLSHYRRYFSKMFWIKNKFVRNLQTIVYPKSIHPISESDLNDILKKYDWVVPVKENLSNMTVYEQYNHFHNIEDLNRVKKIIAKRCPKYLNAFNGVMSWKKISPYNMFYTTKFNFEKYCEWLFPILEEVNKEIDYSMYDEYQTRVIGFLAERLFNVYLQKNNFKIKYLNVYNSDITSRSYIFKKLRGKK